MRPPNPPANPPDPRAEPTSLGPVPTGPEVFGPYLVFERLGVGGMASVHRAKKRGIEGFERTTALKRLLPHLAEDINFVRSFVREAKLASLLQHANIVQLHELGRVRDTYFIAMEYVDGFDLRRLLKRARAAAGPPPPGVVGSIIGAMCDALHYAHTRVDDSTGEPLGLVHRDVSPSNVIVAQGGHVKVLDFGIAKATSARFETETGRVKGKLGYLSPEAVEGLPLDARSDIFSAGTVAYELLTATPLFASLNEFDTLNRIARDAVPAPSRLNPDVPPELDALVLKALAKRPEDRFASAGAMREALDEIGVAHKWLTGTRPVADWIRWAFSPDADGSTPESRPRRRAARVSGDVAAVDAGGPVGTKTESELDEIAELAWGWHEPSKVRAIVGDVPDVSSQALFMAPPDADVDILGVGPVPVPARLARGTTPPPHTTRDRRSQPLPLMPLPEHAEVVGDASVDEDIPTDAIARIDPSVALGDFDPDEPTAPTGPMSTVSDRDVFARPTTARESPAARQVERAQTGRNNADGDPPHASRAARDQRNPTWQLPSMNDTAGPRRRGLAIAAATAVVAAIAFGVGVFGGAGDLARVEFRVSPDAPGARILVDGQTVPGRETELAPGRHEVSISRRGYDDWSARVEVAAGERHTVHVALRPTGQTHTGREAADGDEPASATADSQATPAHGGAPRGDKAGATAAPIPDKDGNVAIAHLDRVHGEKPYLRDNDLARARLCINKRGRVANVEVLREPRWSSSRRFARELRAWRFSPFVVDGTPIAVCTIVEFKS